MKLVLDASVILRNYVGGPYRAYAEKVIETVLEYPNLFAVPELIAYEVLNGLYLFSPYAAEIYEFEINRILHSGILRYPMTENIFRRADRFIRMGLTGYDAAYVAMAEELNGQWLTFDSKAHALIHDLNFSIDLSEGLPEGWE